MNQGYQVEAISRARATIVDALAVGARRHMVHGFVEVDVTRARRSIRQHELETGEALSFTAFIVAAAARAIAAHKHLNAYLSLRAAECQAQDLRDPALLRRAVMVSELGA